MVPPFDLFLFEPAHGGVIDRKADEDVAALGQAFDSSRSVHMVPNTSLTMQPSLFLETCPISIPIRSWIVFCLRISSAR